MNVLQILAMDCEEWTVESEVIRLAKARPKLVPELLDTLKKRDFVLSKTDEGKRSFQITPAGRRQLSETRTQRKISSFPPMMAFG